MLKAMAVKTASVQLSVAPRSTMMTTEKPTMNMAIIVYIRFRNALAPMHKGTISARTSAWQLGAEQPAACGRASHRAVCKRTLGNSVGALLDHLNHGSAQRAISWRPDHHSSARTPTRPRTCRRGGWGSIRAR
jgi:hypothetical protein